jgi:FSR family fosmidomycin resistance protein-like MFS transporter
MASINGSPRDMGTKSIPLSLPAENEFQTGQVIPIVAGHFIHDTYTAFVAPLLPVIIDKLSLSLTLAGSLTAFMQFPGLLNPFIGYLAESISLRYFVIFAPGLTATLISSLGFAHSYFALALILLVTGVSIAAFHAPAPAMIANVSGNQVGKGMSLFMAGGELGRTIGPLVVVWAVSTWTLDGLYRVVILGWAASLLLFIRLRKVKARAGKPVDLRAMIPVARSIFIPIILIIFFQGFLFVCLTIYLPTYMDFGGSGLWVAGGSLSLLEVAGVAGALLSGTLSDRLGRRRVLLGAAVFTTIFLLAFLGARGWVLVPVLLALGFTALSTTPVILAVVQDHFKSHRAVGNGLYMSISFVLRPLATVAVGAFGERFGLHSAFFWSALVYLISIPAIFSLPALANESDIPPAIQPKE